MKMKDADLVGYPVVVVVGKYWAEHGECEVQCRRLGIKALRYGARAATRGCTLF